MQYQIYSFTSKKSGKPCEALKIKIGEYETLIFPTKIEMIYLKGLIKEEAHKDFENAD